MRRILIKFIVVLTTTINFSCSGPKVVKSLNNGGKIIPGAIHTNVPYGIDSRQWLNIYQAPSSVPTPIYIWAHANNHTANDTREFVEYLKATGISTISWESLPNFESPNAAESIWADSELMFQWVKANAEKYNLDASKIIIGGQSRGTVASWRMAHSLDPAIKGIYYIDAVLNMEISALHDEIKRDSPPIMITYWNTPANPKKISMIRIMV